MKVPRLFFLAFAALCIGVIALALTSNEPASEVIAQDEAASSTDMCATCHSKTSAALVMEWKKSSHADNGVGCLECHQAKEGEVDAWKHKGKWISTLVTPKDCAECHEDEVNEFSVSHHAKAGEILASLDNVLAEKVIGKPDNNFDAVNGCWQCHGSIIKFRKDDEGNVLKGESGQPLLDPETWPNSGMGRLNPDGSKGSCNACHSRHRFDAKLARQPENCGKCHMGPDHPQIEIYNESKHGIAYRANKEEMALDKDGDWVLGEDYSAAPTCATCHISSYIGPDGKVVGKTHDVGERISWTLRPKVSSKLNQIIFEDGTKEDYPHTRTLPEVGAEVDTVIKFVENEKMASKKVKKKVASIITWQERRGKMKEMCASCHSNTHVDNFYEQYDGLVDLYNEKFGQPSLDIMNELVADGILDKNAPFGDELRWIYFELWHHEGRRARHGAAMMGPDYTHWHGMYEVAHNFYNDFLPEVIHVAEKHSDEMGKKYREKIEKLLAQEDHVGLKGLSAEEAERLRKEYEERYGGNK